MISVKHQMSLSWKLEFQVLLLIVTCSHTSKTHSCEKRKQYIFTVKSYIELWQSLDLPSNGQPYHVRKSLSSRFQNFTMTLWNQNKLKIVFVYKQQSDRYLEQEQIVWKQQSDRYLCLCVKKTKLVYIFVCVNNKLKDNFVCKQEY